jgi:hypothetical protein
MANKTLKGNIKNMLTYEQFLNIIINDNETIYTKLDKIEKSNDLLIKYKLSMEILDTKIPDNVIAVKRVTDLIEKLQKIVEAHHLILEFNNYWENNKKQEIFKVADFQIK